MLIVEGADLVGKTTFAKSLVKHLNEMGYPHIYKHFTRLPDSTMWRRDPVKMYRESIVPHVVQDRFHMSEPVYALAARNDRPLLDQLLYQHVDAHVTLAGGFTVLICVDENHEHLLEERFAKLEQREMYSLDKVLAVNRAYRDIAHRQWEHGYHGMRFDMVLLLDDDVPFPTEGHLVTASRMYRENYHRSIGHKHA